VEVVSPSTEFIAQIVYELGRSVIIDGRDKAGNSSGTTLPDLKPMFATLFVRELYSNTIDRLALSLGTDYMVSRGACTQRR